MIGRAVSKHKHKGSESQATRGRKPQKTMVFENVRGDRYRRITDMGWSDPYWNRIKRSIFVDCVLAIKPLQFICVRVPSDHIKAIEAFETFCRRNGVDWFQIKAKQSSGVNSYFFLHNVPPNIEPKLIKYSKMKATPSVAVLEILLHKLLHWKLHPDGERVHRFKCSDGMLLQIRINLVKQMWQQVRYDAKRLASYIKADTVLGLRRLSIGGILDLLNEAGLSQSDKLAVLKALTKREWKRLLPYKGLPEDGAKEEELEKFLDTPVYSVVKSKTSSYSERLIPPMGTWDTTPRTQDREVYL